MKGVRKDRGRKRFTVISRVMPKNPVSSASKSLKVLRAASLEDMDVMKSTN